ncbi:16S rRNA (guanine(966)-N(2))-methyltransferase RsmD [Aeromicrobium sp.]|uniref:16S rRNA (guanine(966)-N(2))-methyltransferase RsmD n=1 Tax=Aeromicrobium sp. TaxID=1871063 RepID=UPI0030BE7B8F
MTRIIAGRYGGRRIQVPKGDGTRPTSDRVREAMFSSIQSALGGFDEDLRVLDLFAGSGALGLEAMSRGAGFAQFVESNARAVSVIKQNIRTLGADAAVARMTAEKYPTIDPPGAFGLIFLDPPYALGTSEVTALVASLKMWNTQSEALLVVERSSRDRFTWPDGVDALRDKTYGETTLWYGR